MDNLITELHLLEIILTFITSIVASSGFWMFIAKKNQDKDTGRRLLIGLAHDRIVSLSMTYIGRGWVTQDEYENLCVYLFQPYKEMGGNGTALRLMAEVDKLPIQKTLGRKDVYHYENVK